MEDLSDEGEGNCSDQSEEADNEKHAELLKSLSSLGGHKRSKAAVRTEPSALVSEFHLSEGNGKVKVHELLKSLNASSKIALSKKQLRTAARKSRVLDTPLPKPQAEKVKRTVAYGKVSKEVSKWDSVVNKNRTAECLEFPLNKPLLKMHTNNFVQRFEIKTPLEMEVSRLLSGNDDAISQDTVLSPAEERALKAMSLEEARERLQELQKMRALLTYQEAKARRQNKIKSKRYRRILKKDRLKKQLAEFEELKKINPEQALEKLQELDKRRIEERLTLKHKNSGKWAKQSLLRSKYDKQTRDALSDQLELNRQLTRKVNKNTASSDESETEEVPSKVTEDFQPANLPTNYNAWMRNQTAIPTVAQPASSFDPKSIVTLKVKKKTMTLKQKVLQNVEVPIVEVVEEPENLSEEPTKFPSEELPIDDSSLSVPPATKEISEKPEKTSIGEKATDVLVDPSKFVGAKPKILLSQAPVLMDSGDEGLDDEPGSHLTIREAFADDDVLEEFKYTKEEAVDSSKPKDLDLFLPGWGDWGGSGIIPSKKRKRRFLVKAAPAAPRKDHNLGNVIINEEKESSISNHLVSELPFPFKSVQQFETSIGHPLGSTWNPQTSFQDMVLPEVKIQKGKIIDPIDGGVLLKKKPKRLNKKRKTNKE